MVNDSRARSAPGYAPAFGLEETLTVIDPWS
jgi:hypothetical protein